ncbi:hypothetical protein GJ744_006623 [Endocarpon pusillum]|uniref:Uncharacterized protein n=1 Tax=Endocarpon pusillum TaxID=364733 RepID=A0A8H7AUY6_9EURO|nr:hypothetical protein GJ744_006623 [Endocarpon pusillum]
MHVATVLSLTAATRTTRDNSPAAMPSLAHLSAQLPLSAATQIIVFKSVSGIPMLLSNKHGKHLNLVSQPANPTERYRQRGIIRGEEGILPGRIFDTSIEEHYLDNVCGTPLMEFSRGL